MRKIAITVIALSISIASIAQQHGAFQTSSNASQELGVTSGQYTIGRFLNGNIVYGTGTNSVSLGIGVANPANNVSLHTLGPIRSNALASSGVRLLSNNNQGVIELFPNGTSGQVLTYGTTGPQWANLPAQTIDWSLNGNSATASNFIGTINNQDLRLYTNNTQKMVIKSNGFVGIGVANPTESLHLNGNFRLNNAFMPNNNAGLSGQVLISQGANTSPAWTNLPPTVDGSNFWNVNGNNSITPVNFIGTINNQDLRIRTSNIQRMVVNTVGFVGIGVNVPQTLAHFVIDPLVGYSGTVLRLSKKNGGPGAEVRLDMSTIDLDDNPNVNTRIAVRDMGYYDGSLVFYTDGDGLQNTSLTSRMIINHMGRVGIGTEDPSYKLDVQGDINANGNVRANGVVISSDSRFKDNVKKIETALSKINKITGYSYNFKKDNTYSNKNFSTDMALGVLAQEIKEVFPELVSQDANGYFGVNYIGLIPVLIEAIKEQKKSIDALSNSNSRKSNINSNTSESIESEIKLLQNIPNPFSESTEIKFELGRNSKNAAIFIYNMQGTQLKKFDNLSGNGSVIINGNELNAGMYLYSLIVDGIEINTKRMILTK